MSTCITIRVKPDHGRPEEIVLQSSSTIGALKLKIQEKTGIPPQSQSLTLLGLGPVDFEDNDRPLESILEGNSTLYLRDSRMAVEEDVHGNSQGHMYLRTTTNDTTAQQGNLYESGFVGSVPISRGVHTFVVTESVRSILQQGDQFIVSRNPPNVQQNGQFPANDGQYPPHQAPDNATLRGQVAHQGQDCDGGGSSGVAVGPSGQSGHRYDQTVSRGALLLQGNTVTSGFYGTVPAGGGNRYGVTECTGGSLSQGNWFGTNGTVVTEALVRRQLTDLSLNDRV